MPVLPQKCNYTTHQDYRDVWRPEEWLTLIKWCFVFSSMFRVLLASVGRGDIKLQVEEKQSNFLFRGNAKQIPVCYLAKWSLAQTLSLLHMEPYFQRETVNMVTQVYKDLQHRLIMHKTSSCCGSRGCSENLVLNAKWIYIAELWRGINSAFTLIMLGNSEFIDINI